MDYLLMIEVWLVLAAIFGLAELILPGGISLNLSISSLLVALGLKLSVLESWISALTFWFICASILFFVIYYFTKKVITSDETVENVYEELDIFGQEAEVIENIGPGERKGRISFQGTSWTALGDGSVIEAGTKVKVICKDNISLIVEQV